ncbi:hypothetical protein WDU94_004544 [Cyamophila willieti]
MYQWETLKQSTKVVPKALYPLQNSQSQPFVENEHEEITIAIVICGDVLQEGLTLIKSAIIFQQKHPLKFLIFTESNLIQSVEEKLSDWQVLKNHSFSFEILNLQFPKNREKEWKTLFKKCASQRLFFADILPHIDSLMYMDADSLFLGPVYDVWSHFHQMNSTQMAALAIESEDLNSAWYGRFARHPYYGKTGLNSGVMLMNLTRMRSFGWGNYLGPILKQFKTKMVFGDQDIINIIFYYHPETLLLFQCRFNFRTDHCRYMPNCESAMSDGVVVMHGSRAAFLSNKVPPFTLIYQAFQEIGGDRTGINYETNYLTYILKVSQPLALR